jgi:hypothetical protein
MTQADMLGFCSATLRTAVVSVGFRQLGSTPCARDSPTMLLRPFAQSPRRQGLQLLLRNGMKDAKDANSPPLRTGILVK